MNRITNTAEMTLTKSQESVLTDLYADILRHDGNGVYWRSYEYKNLEVTQFEGSGLVFLASEVGRKGDEGTLNEIVSRTRRHFSIGPRGGVELINARDRRFNGRHNARRRPIRGYHRALISLTA